MGDLALPCFPLARVLRKRGQPVEAERMLREALAIYARETPGDRWFLPLTRIDLASALADQGRYAEAEPILLEGWETLRRTPGEEDAVLDPVRERVAAFYRDWGKPDLAARYGGSG